MHVHIETRDYKVFHGIHGILHEIEVHGRREANKIFKKFIEISGYDMLIIALDNTKLR